MFELILQASLETLLIVSIAFVIGVVIGVPLAATLFVAKNIYPNAFISYPIDMMVDLVRSLPYIILLIALIPVTRWVLGSSIGTMAAAFPLGVASIALVARVVYEAFHSVPKELIDLARSLRATRFQIVSKFLIPEALPSIVGNMTIVIINLICYSAMAGLVGGGGLGDLAVRYGYQRYNYVVMMQVVLVLVVLVQMVQLFGNFIAKKLRK